MGLLGPASDGLRPRGLSRSSEGMRGRSASILGLREACREDFDFARSKARCSSGNKGTAGTAFTRGNVSWGLIENALCMGLLAMGRGGPRATSAGGTAFGRWNERIGRRSRPRPSSCSGLELRVAFLCSEAERIVPVVRAGLPSRDNGLPAETFSTEGRRDLLMTAGKTPLVWTPSSFLVRSPIEIGDEPLLGSVFVRGRPMGRGESCVAGAGARAVPDRVLPLDDSAAAARALSDALRARASCAALGD